MAKDISKSLFKKYLKSVFNELIDTLRKDAPNAVFVFSDRTDVKAQATCDKSFNPPVITIYLNNIIDFLHPQTIRISTELITHELIHCIQGKCNAIGLKGEMMEKEAYTKQNKLRFWNG